MNKKELKKFETLLLQERAQLLGSIKNIEDESRHANNHDSSGDLTSYAEAGTDSFEMQTALNIASGESERLAEIDDALERIRDGSYGVCEGTGEPIPKRRLEVFPSARFTVAYQEQLEKENRM